MEVIPIPCPHFKITIVKRSQGQSAVAGAAYQSGERLFKDDEIQLAIDSFTGPEGNALSLKAVEINKLSPDTPAALADAAKN